MCTEFSSPATRAHHQRPDVSVGIDGHRCTTHGEPPRLSDRQLECGGMDYWVVSDLNAQELRTFCTLVREADAVH